ncbi:hypothetical protein GCM10009720_08850 [Yaniella flava]|uniref:DUF3784 domain-containing protein n=1 Tax=Yaniella flava TaxID=287930 RepID=A0ABN2U849_9MICC
MDIAEFMDIHAMTTTKFLIIAGLGLVLSISITFLNVAKPVGVSEEDIEKYGEDADRRAQGRILYRRLLIIFGLVLFCVGMIGAMAHLIGGIQESYGDETARNTLFVIAIVSAAIFMPLVSIMRK